MGLHVGIGRTQNQASQVMNDVRDEGAEYKAANGRSRGYNTKAGLDFHMDSGDIVGLLCRRTAKSGGESLVASTIAVAANVHGQASAGLNDDTVLAKILDGVCAVDAFLGLAGDISIG